jgi:hypothetical protein
MAIVEKNIILEGLRGKLGKMLVFRQRGGKTIVAATLRKTDKAPSEAQEIRREKFRQADEGRVTAVTVAFYRPDGSLAEEGAAEPGEQETAWIYTARENVEGWEELRPVVRATDLPGNVAEKEIRPKEVM